MLVVEELEHEIKMLQALKKQYEICNELSMERERLEDEYERLCIALNAKKSDREILQKELCHLAMEELQTKAQSVFESAEKARILEQHELKNYHTGFHPIWGELMKAGRQNSRFSAQVQNYACLYTSKVTNIKHYGTHKNYRAVRDDMPHDMDI